MKSGDDSAMRALHATDDENSFADAIDRFCPFGLIDGTDASIRGVWAGVTSKWRGWGWEKTPVEYRGMALFRGEDGRPVRAGIVFAVDEGADVRSLALAGVEKAILNPPKAMNLPGDTFVGGLRRLGLVRQRERGSRGPRLAAGSRAAILGSEAVGAVWRSLLDGGWFGAFDTAKITVARAMAPTIEAFGASLDPDALAFTERFPERDEPWAYDWISDKIWMGLDSTFSPDAPLRVAMDSFPEHSGFLSWVWEVSPERFMGSPEKLLLRCLEWANEIEREREGPEWANELERERVALQVGVRGQRSRGHGRLIRALREDASAITAACAVENGLRRGMDRLDFNSLRPSIPDSLGTSAALMLLELPSDWVPATASDWEALIALIPQMKLASQLFRYGSTMSEFLNSRGRWSEFAARLHAATGRGGDRYLDIRSAITDIKDMMVAFADQVVAPVACVGERTAAHSTRALARAVLFGRRALPRILEDSAWWHGRVTAIANVLSRLPNSGPRLSGWKKGIPDWSVGGIDLIVLEDKPSLAREGLRGVDEFGSEGLAHCVGGYGSPCRLGRSRIVSLRRAGSSPQGRLSTAEIGWRNQAFRVVQHKAFANSKPSDECSDALARYVAALGNELAVDWSGLARMGSADGVAEKAGYDPDVPGSWEAALSLWAHVLPAPVKKWTRADFEFLARADCPANVMLAALHSETPSLDIDSDMLTKATP